MAPHQVKLLVTAHIGHAEGVAAKIHAKLPPFIQIEDLIQEAMVGMCQAAAKYKPSSNVPFWAFAHRRVHGAVIDSIRRKNFQHTSTHQLDSLRRPGSDSIVDLDAIEGLTIECDPSEQMDRAEVRKEVTRAVRTLDRQSQKVIELRYRGGLNGKQTGQELEVCESVSSQLHRTALRRLRGSSHARHLKGIQMKQQTSKVVDIEAKRVQLMVDELGEIDGRLDRVKRDTTADTARRKEIHGELLKRVPKDHGAAEGMVFYGKTYAALVSACSNKQEVVPGAYEKVQKWMGAAFYQKCKVTLEVLKAFLSPQQYAEVVTESRTGPRSISTDPVSEFQKALHRELASGKKDAA